MTDSQDVPFPAFTEHRIQRDRGSVYVRDFAGSGPAFVVLHGFQTTRTSTMTFYGDAPGLRVPELIALFSNKELKALNLHFLQRPQQFAWLLDFQRNQLQAGLTATQKIRYFEFLGPISTTTSRSNPVPPWPSRR